MCAEHKKPRKLLKHLESVREAGRGARNPPCVLIFANRVKTVRFVAAATAGAGFKTAILHGERSQAERDVRLDTWTTHSTCLHPQQQRGWPLSLHCQAYNLSGGATPASAVTVPV